MSDVALVPFRDDEAEALVDFLCGEEWPFHGDPLLTPGSVRERIGEGYFSSEDVRTLWVVSPGGERIGMVRLYDLGDETPMFDIRIAARLRGRGVGSAAVRAIATYVFGNFDHVSRIEAHTRNDNIAMRKVLRRCGYAKEAHHRRAWPVDGGEPQDSIGYGILRGDWLAGTVTPVDWNDEP